MKANFKCVPVLLIGSNRPDFMAAQIDVVRLASPTMNPCLLVYSTMKNNAKLIPNGIF